jgi:hypothetical protein
MSSLEETLHRYTCLYHESNQHSLNKKKMHGYHEYQSTPHTLNKASNPKNSTKNPTRPCRPNDPVCQLSQTTRSLSHRESKIFNITAWTAYAVDSSRMQQMPESC